MNYPFKSIEENTQKIWESQNIFHASEKSTKPKFYCLSMFPYPSGRLHMGHVRNYTIGDMLSRYRRMCGDNVLQPLGWDAFGMPAENAAIDNKIPPAKWTYANIDEMRTQLKRLGLAIDWDREITTCDASYYKWEQLFFIKLYKEGVIYKKTGVVNWDPVDHTVLANEQVVDGRGWRSGALIERRQIPMYFMKITDYADELLDELDNLEHWPEAVKTMQRNWIGRSYGARVKAKIDGQDTDLEFFTTRPDTIYGMTFCGIAPEHPVSLKAAETDPKLAAFIKDCQKLAATEEALETVEKEGYRLPFDAIHPLQPDRKIPIFVANYILAQYGTGAIYGCPAHDQRDLDFARKYNLDVIPVVLPADADTHSIKVGNKALIGNGVMVNSESLNGFDNEQAKLEAIKLLEQNNRGKTEKQYRLRDWGISRQRYWGCIIPIVHCDACGDVLEKEENLPIRLPLDVEISGRGSPLTSKDDFINCLCPQCGNKASRETDTMDTFVESSWYFSRYTSHDCDTKMIDERADYWMPADQYIGGIEHACLHLLYARFYHKLMRDAGMFKDKSAKYNEPFTRLLCQGMVLKNGTKMSKSKGNTVDPQILIDEYGADTARLFTIFASPPEQSLEWSDDGIKGCYRFLNRLWVAAESLKEWEEKTAGDDSQNALLHDSEKKINAILQKAQFDMERMRYNNIPSAAMQIVNIIYTINTTTGAAKLLRYGISAVLRLLAPAVPHITQQLWRSLGFGDMIIDAPWPTAQTLDSNSTVSLVVQINGKKRGIVEVLPDEDQQSILEKLKQDEGIGKYLSGTPKKVIIVPKKLINIVV